ncbi:MAG: 16S rRNA processing protein RimM, partial [Eubacterium sp.]|nr:16S rRNA processing protein RimM [Eubacterium sp.]
MDEMLRVGVVTKPHGLKGEVKVYPTTSDPKRFKDLDVVYL